MRAAVVPAALLLVGCPGNPYATRPVSSDPAEACKTYMLRMIDPDRNGVITLEEYKATKQIPVGFDPAPPSPVVVSTGDIQVSYPGPPSDSSLDASFKKLDLNGDGTFNQAELCEALAKGP